MHNRRGLRSTWEARKWRKLPKISGSRSVAKKGRRERGHYQQGNVRSRKGFLKVMCSPRSLQRNKLKRKKIKKKDNCGSEIFEKTTADGINAQVEGLCSDRSRDTVRVISRERSVCVCGCRSGSGSGSGKKREFSADCLYFLSELGMRGKTLGDVRRARYEIITWESRQHITEV